MNRILLSIATAIALLIPGVPVSAESGYLNEKDIELLNKVDSHFMKFSSVYEKAENGKDLKEPITYLKNSLNAVAAHNFSTEVSDEYTNAAKNVKEKASKLAKPLDMLPQEGEGNVTKASAEFEKAFNPLYTDYRTSIDEMNKVIDNSTAGEMTIYTLTLVGAAILAIGSFVWAFKEKKFREARKPIALASLWPLGGALITFLTFTFAEHLGGSYTIAWGAILIGLVYYVRAIVAYRNNNSIVTK